jgi:hypothetical protein
MCVFSSLQQLGEMFEHAEDNVEELDEQKDKVSRSFLC